MEGLTDFETFMRDHEGDPIRLMERIMSPFEHEVLDTSDLFHGCTCSEAKMLAAIVSLGREEITNIVEQGETLKVDCDYCKTQYKLYPNQLQGLLELS
jgi:molecular chaperone Hsp33